MDRYIHLQTMPNSPLTPLTPLSENTAFDFNFGGDGSLDVYIESVRQEHRVQQQQKKLLQQANKSYHKPGCPKQPKHYSEEFLKIRNVFEGGELDQEQDNKSMRGSKAATKRNRFQQINLAKPRTPKVKITHTGATPTTKMLTSTQKTPRSQIITDYETTPTNVRTPLKNINHNISLNLPSKSFNMPQQKFNHQQNRRRQTFRLASPVASKPLCPRVAKILRRNGLSMYHGVFQREEIDMFTFRMIKLQDLHQMGITNPKHCELIMAEIYYAGKSF